MGEVLIEPNALKHGLSPEEVRYAWDTPIACRQRNGQDDPPIWIAVGVLPDGCLAELVAFEDRQGRWRVFHAMTPPTKKFQRELRLNRR